MSPTHFPMARKWSIIVEHTRYIYRDIRTENIRWAFAQKGKSECHIGRTQDEWDPTDILSFWVFVPCKKELNAFFPVCLLISGHNALICLLFKKLKKHFTKSEWAVVKKSLKTIETPQQITIKPSKFHKIFDQNF